MLEQKLAKEVTLGKRRGGGPFDNIPLPTLRVSPVGLVPQIMGLSDWFTTYPIPIVTLLITLLTLTYAMLHVSIPVLTKKYLYSS